MWISFDDQTISLFVEYLTRQGHTSEAASLCERLKTDETHTHAIELYRGAAKGFLHDEGNLEFDDDAVVSFGADPGAYVMAWKWVPEELVDQQSKSSDTSL